MRTPTRFPLMLALSLCGVVAARSVRADSLSDTVNESIRQLRGIQSADGWYGAGDTAALTTARVLQGFGEWTEQYTVQDGPFVRGAVEALVKTQNPDGSFGPAADRPDLTAEVVLALLVTAPASHMEARESAIAFLSRLPEQTDVVRRALSAAKKVVFDAPLAADAARALIEAAIAKDLGGDAERLAVRQLSHAAAGESKDGADLAKRLSAVVQERQIATIRPLSGARALDVANRVLALIELQAVLPSSGRAATEAPAELIARPLPSNDDELKERIASALAYLEKNQKDGQFGISGVPDPGVTALALAAVQQASAKFALARPSYVDSGLAWLVSLQKPDGGIYDKGLKNYVTSIAVEALVASNDPKHADAVKKAVEFLKATQLDEGEGYSAEEDPYYGGFGYGGSEKPDLSNTQIALDAMHSAGVSTQDAAWQKAIEFLERCQNRAESGTPPITKKDGSTIVPGTDGGATYRPGDSKAGTEPTGDEGKVIARSYGSMTYALLKSYLFAGLDPKDPRVVAAVGWVQQHYTLEMNPGFPTDKNQQYQGLFYYYLALSRALDAYGQDVLVDAAGKEHHWKTELRDHLLSLQQQDGAWLNARHSRWMEGTPELVTAYALLTLAEVR